MWFYIFTSFVGILSVIYLWMRKKFSYFRSHGVIEEPGYFPFGSKANWKMMTGKLAFTSVTDDIYKDYPNERFVGTYGPFGQPILVIRDLELGKNVMVKDFDHFVDRRTIQANPKSNKYFLEMLTMLTGDKWKTMRSILSPVFTSGKLKNMLPIIHGVSDEFIDHLKPYAKEGKEIDAKELLTSFTLDVISSAGLGIKANALSDPESVLRKKVAILLGQNDPLNFLRIIIIFVFPKLGKLLNIPFINVEATEFVVKVIRSSLEQRRKEKVRKNDLIDILIDTLNNYQNSTNTAAEEEEDQFEKDAKLNMKVSKATFTNEEIESALISNALLLFFAGFDTTSTGMSLVCHFLATNPDVQEQLYREVMDAIEQNDGNQHLDYNTVQMLPYLDQVVNESLRMYPLTFVERVCVKDYKIPGSDFVIPKGMLVQIASPMIMKDEKYFEEPERFNPENFSPENKAKRSPYAFLSFGQGPRNCIGMRFALLQVKIAVAMILANYRIIKCGKTVDKLVTDPFSRSFLPIGGLWFKVESR